MLKHLSSHPNSLYLKVRIAPLPCVLMLAAAACFTVFLPDLLVPGMFSAVVFGVLVSAMAPMWVRRGPVPATFKLQPLRPLFAFKPPLEPCLLAVALFSLAVGVSDLDSEAGQWSEIIGSAFSGILLAPWLPIWEYWPVKIPKSR